MNRIYINQVYCATIFLRKPDVSNLKQAVSLIIMVAACTFELTNEEDGRRGEIAR